MSYLPTEAASRHPALKAAVKQCLSVRKLALRVGVDMSVISRWLNGHRGLSASVAVRVAQELGVTVDTVLVKWAKPVKVSRHELRPDLYPVERKGRRAPRR